VELFANTPYSFEKLPLRKFLERVWEKPFFKKVLPQIRPNYIIRKERTYETDTLCRHSFGFTDGDEFVG
jgi:hypothetical protein